MTLVAGQPSSPEELWVQGEKDQSKAEVIANDEWPPAPLYCRYEVAKAFASANAKVIMVNRKEEQGTEAISKIKTEVDPEAKIQWRQCDLGNLKEVQSVFNNIADDEERMDLASGH